MELYFKTDKGFYTPVLENWSYSIPQEGVTLYLNHQICSEKCVLFLNEILKSSNDFSCVKDFSKITGGGICHNLQIIKDDLERSYSHSICVNISLLIPVFHIHVLQLNRKSADFSKWNGLPFRQKELEKTIFLEEITNITDFLINRLNLIKFPDNLINEKVDGIFTEDINKNDFTFYTALFQREFYTR